MRTITASRDCSPTAMHAMGEPAAASLAASLKALADPLRLRMLSAIASDGRGEACACDLASLTEVSQPTVSHHLKVLKEAGLLEAERRGTWVWYRLAQGRTHAVTSLLEGFAPAALAPRSTRSAYHGLDDVDGALVHAAERLAAAFPAIHSDTVTALVRESYAGLARSARISAHLVPLTERFARQRLTDMTRPTDAPPQVLFVCVANAGRSQLAAALVNSLSAGAVVARSAGSQPAAGVHPSVRPLLEQIHAETAVDAFPKPLTDDAVRAADVVITMGCGDVCPIIPGVRYEDWAVGDPALASPDGVAAIREDIETRVRELLADLSPHHRTESQR